MPSHSRLAIAANSPGTQLPRLSAAPQYDAIVFACASASSPSRHRAARRLATPPLTATAVVSPSCSRLSLHRTASLVHLGAVRVGPDRHHHAIYGTVMRGPCRPCVCAVGLRWSWATLVALAASRQGALANYPPCPHRLLSFISPLPASMRLTASISAVASWPRYA